MDWLDHHSSHFSIHHQPSLGDSSEEVTNSHWYNKDSVANMARGVDSRVRGKDSRGGRASLKVVDVLQALR